MDRIGARARFWWRQANRSAWPTPYAVAPRARSDHAPFVTDALLTRRQPITALPGSLRPMLAAALAGAMIFAGATGFGRAARIVEPMPQQLDQLLISAGIGINEVTVKGFHYAVDAEIFAAVALDTSGSLVSYDVAAAQRRIEALAWVKRATIVRVLPDKLRIEIVERRPAAIWEHAGRTALVDAEGRVLAYLAGSALPPLLRIAGAGAPTALSGLICDVVDDTAFSDRIIKANWIGGRRWTLDLEGGSSVHLPEGRAKEGIRRLAAHLSNGDGRFAAGQAIDLRLSGQIVVQAAPAKDQVVGRRTVME